MSVVSIATRHTLVLVFCVGSSSLTITQVTHTMKTVLAIAALASLAVTAHAQLNPVPPSAVTNDGITILPAQASWAGSALSDYYFASDDNLGTPNMHSPDNVDGLNWQHTINSSVASALSNINTNGGTIRSIFVGESAGWQNNFGYTYDGKPNSATQSFTLFSSVQAAGATPDITNGEYADISLSKGQASKFDFWLDGVGNTVNPTQFGGVYTAIDQANSTPAIAPGNVLWASSAIEVPTFVQSLNNGAGGWEDVATFLVGFEDWRLDSSQADKDYNDFVFAIQLFDQNGTPFTPVPEPSTYGLIGAAALVGLVARRRFAAKK